MAQKIEVAITAEGGIAMLHDDALDLSEFGRMKVKRASHVEYDPGYSDSWKPGWYVQSAKTGQVLASGFKTRAEALAWEKQHYSPSGEGWKELQGEGR